MKLLLFDIDGTLIRSSGAGRDAMKMALEDVYGQSGPIAKLMRPPPTRFMREGLAMESNQVWSEPAQYLYMCILHDRQSLFQSVARPTAQHTAQHCAFFV